MDILAKDFYVYRVDGKDLIVYCFKNLDDTFLKIKNNVMLLEKEFPLLLTAQVNYDDLKLTYDLPNHINSKTVFCLRSFVSSGGIIVGTINQPDYQQLKKFYKICKKINIPDNMNIEKYEQSLSYRSDKNNESIYQISQDLDLYFNTYSRVRILFSESPQFQLKIKPLKIPYDFSNSIVHNNNEILSLSGQSLIKKDQRDHLIESDTITSKLIQTINQEKYISDDKTSKIKNKFKNFNFNDTQNFFIKSEPIEIFEHGNDLSSQAYPEYSGLINAKTEMNQYISDPESQKFCSDEILQSIKQIIDNIPLPSTTSYKEVKNDQVCNNDRRSISKNSTPNFNDSSAISNLEVSKNSSFLNETSENIKSSPESINISNMCNIESKTNTQIEQKVSESNAKQILRNYLLQKKKIKGVYSNTQYKSNIKLNDKITKFGKKLKSNKLESKVSKYHNDGISNSYKVKNKIRKPVSKLNKKYESINKMDNYNDRESKTYIENQPKNPDIPSSKIHNIHFSDKETHDLSNLDENNPLFQPISAKDLIKPSLFEKPINPQILKVKEEILLSKFFTYKKPLTCLTKPINLKFKNNIASNQTSRNSSPISQSKSNETLQYSNDKLNECKYKTDTKIPNIIISPEISCFSSDSLSENKGKIFLYIDSEFQRHIKLSPVSTITPCKKLDLKTMNNKISSFKRKNSPNQMSPSYFPVEKSLKISLNHATSPEKMYKNRIYRYSKPASFKKWQNSVKKSTKRK